MKAIKIMLSATILLMTGTAHASMNAEVFYQRAAKLEKKGMAAMFSSDLKPLMNEMKTSSKALKAENEAARKRGKPIYCLPKKRKGMSAKQVLSEFRALGPAKRKSMNVRQAWRSILVKRYPCR